MMTISFKCMSNRVQWFWYLDEQYLAEGVQNLFNSKTYFKKSFHIFWADLCTFCFKVWTFTAFVKKINMVIKKARVQIRPRSCKKVIQKKALTKGEEIWSFLTFVTLWLNFLHGHNCTFCKLGSQKVQRIAGKPNNIFYNRAQNTI